MPSRPATCIESGPSDDELHPLVEVLVDIRKRLEGNPTQPGEKTMTIPKYEQRNLERTRHHLHVLSDRMKEVTETISKLQDELAAIKKKKTQLIQTLHEKCPHCHGTAEVRYSDGYDSGHYYGACQYKVEWLLGEEEPPEHWGQVPRPRL